MIDASNYRLGVAVMDLQHSVLLGYINRLDQHSDDLGTLIAAFSSYAESHFKEEEALMTTSDYPARITHLAAHAQYREKFEGLIGEALEGSPMVWKSMLAFLEKWWTEHIHGVDKNLAEYLLEHGFVPKAG